MNYKALIREVPDFPKPGILFYDITTPPQNAQAYRAIADELAARYEGQGIAKVIGIESRGSSSVAPWRPGSGAGFVPVRKPGKLPADILRWNTTWNTGPACWQSIGTRSRPESGC